MSSDLRFIKAIQPFLIAEIGYNHKGDMGIAWEMIDVAALSCKVDAVKFQKCNPSELLSAAQYNATPKSCQFLLRYLRCPPRVP